MPIRKLVGYPVRQPLANLGLNSLLKGGPQGVFLLWRKLGEPIGNPIRKPLSQLVRNPFSHDHADECL